jgi:hypothetical protein
MASAQIWLLLWLLLLLLLKQCGGVRQLGLLLLQQGRCCLGSKHSTQERVLLRLVQHQVCALRGGRRCCSCRSSTSSKRRRQGASRHEAIAVQLHL